MASNLYYKPIDTDHRIFEAIESDSIGWRGYLSKVSLPNNPLSLGDAWNNKGAFVFAAARPSVEDLEKIAESLKDQKDEIWIKWLDDKKITIKLKPDRRPNHYITIKNFNFSLGRTYSFSIAEKTNVIFNAQQDRLEFVNITSLNIENNIQFLGNPEGLKIESQNVILPLGGKNGGAFRFTVDIASDALNRLMKLALKYYCEVGQDPLPSERKYPVFEPNSGEWLRFRASLDPVDPYNQHYEPSSDIGLRSYLAFQPHPSPPIFPSHFRTSFGHRIMLTPEIRFDQNPSQEESRPAAGSGLLAFSPEFGDGAYVIPQGHFYLSTDKPVASLRLLSGSTGTETVAFVPANGSYPGDRMLFVPGGNSYWPEDPAEIKNNDFVPELTNRTVTAWIAIVPSEARLPEAEPIVYSSQPEAEPHFLPKAEGVSVYHEPIVYPWTEDNNCVPIVPLLGVERSASAIEQAIVFERCALATNRKKLMDGFSVNGNALAINQEEKWTSTPQGLLVKETGNQWDALLIGQNTGKSVMEKLQFEGLSKTFRNTLLDSRLFLVISIDSKIHWEQFSNKLPISDWPFQINIPEFRPEDPENYDNRNILILKFVPGELADWLKNPALWGNAKLFNNKQASRLSRELVSYCQLDVDESSIPKELLPFYRMCHDPCWTGILALNVDIVKKEMPLELIGLMGGLDPKIPFRAHHIGMNAGRVEWKDGTIRMDKPGSWFGYIHYQGDVHGEWNDDPFGFRVTELKARFDNSAIQTFESRMQLLIRELYESKVAFQDPSQEPVITLMGRIEKHEGVPAFVFQTENETLAEVIGSNPILKTLNLIKISFQTLDANEKIKARFSIWGWKAFIENDMDLFGYGLQGAGLLFSNLGINMEFRLSENSTIEDLKFCFDPVNIELDPAKSKLRENCLADHFPMILRKLIVVNDIEEWTSKGYLKVSTNVFPSPGASGTQRHWYGLEFAINLGTLGKLTPEGSLVGSLIVGWNAEEKVYCGLKIPGLEPVQGMLMLQDMLNLALPDTLILSVDKENKVFHLAAQANANLFGKRYDFKLGIFEPPNDKKKISWYAKANL